MRLTIHAGAHKTATTSIQDWLTRTSKPLCEQNVYYIEPRKLNENAVIEGFHNTCIDNRFLAPKKFMKIVSELRIEQPIRNILVSHESILSYANMLPREIKYGFYGSMANSARCLNTLSNQFETTVVFYVRRQDHFLASVYLQYIMRGNICISFDQYTKRVSYRNVSWLYLLDTLQSALPDVKICVLPYENIQRGTENFLTDFLAACGVDWSERFSSIPLLKSNESISQASLEQLLTEGPSLKAVERRGLANELRKKFPMPQYDKSNVLTDTFSKQVVDYFKDENRELFEKWMPDFMDFCY